jgi:hypothetical protein
LETQAKEIIRLLIERAESGEHVPFKLIQTMREYFTVRTSRRAIKSVIKTLQLNDKRIFKQYCKSTPTGNADVTKLLICNALQDAAEFYKEELKILTDMIDEYDEYLLTNINNLIGAVLFEERPVNKLWDHRSQ